jgi:ribonuclease HII
VPAFEQRKVRPNADVSKATRKLRMLRTLVCDDSYERAAWASGARRIAGIDEVGRGALFGPVVAAAVILPADCHAAVLQAGGLRDSKQLGPEDRERLAALVHDCAAAVAIAEVDAATIDRINIYQATRLAMLRATARLTVAPDHLLIDAMRIDHPCAQTSVIYGDSRSLSIAAASVIAKVYRDARMCELHREYPAYGLDEHKGYGTPAHQRALLRHGPCALHRRSFRPVWESALPWDAGCREGTA